MTGSLYAVEPTADGGVSRAEVDRFGAATIRVAEET
jgi:hypothetical protein